MIPRSDGSGHAFPVQTNHGHLEGMSLRDYFAAKAMQQLIGQTNIAGDKERDNPFHEDWYPDPIACCANDCREWLSQTAYLIADAMLKSRGES